ncbi:MAG: type II secretion system F family protein [Actinomycetota bacterium]|nr:type II secretion system F family protein [Actinomycetota bacterium]
MLYLLIGIAALGTAAFLVAEAATAPARQRTLSVRRAASYGRVRLATRPETLRFSERIVDPAKHRLAAFALRLTPKASIEGVAAKLHASGLARTLSPTGYLAAKAAASIFGLVLGAVMGASRGGAGTILVPLALAGIAFMAPDTVLTMRARGRRDRIQSQLPDALDLLAVSVEAGMGFDSAFQKLTEHMEGDLVDEFVLALGEMRIGESRQDALKRIVDRVDAPEMAAFVRAIIQADQLGISLGRILRVQAADARLRRQAAAEEKAMKAPIKMLFPTVLFIFPAMFLVVLGPAMITLMEIFK